jgi:hypothetical protein|tara:strand:- start:357 stop:776 length:420 start_codon:yes stop_codon:yes gene_type:complete
MATITASLSLSSSDVLPSPMSVNANAVLSADSGSLIRAKVISTAADGATATLRVYEANDKLERAYLFVKNLDRELENYIYVYNEAVGNDDFAKIGGGEFMFLPVAVDGKYEVYGTKANQIIEYGVFGFDNSAVTNTSVA